MGSRGSEVQGKAGYTLRLVNQKKIVRKTKKCAVHQGIQKENETGYVGATNLLYLGKGRKKPVAAGNPTVGGKKRGAPPSTS